MKKVFKWGWIFLVVGLLFLMVGGFAHGAKNVVFNGWRPMVYSTKSNFQKNYAVNDFDQVDAATSNADVTIKRGDNYHVSYHGRKSARPNVRVLNGRLTVRQKGSTEKNGFIGFKWFNYNQDENNKVTIYVPDNVKLKKVRNLNNYGQTQMQGISIANLEAIGSDGSLKLHNMNVDTTNIEMRDGSAVRLENTNLLNGLLTSEDCDVDIQNGALRNVELQQDNGDVSMHNVALDGGKANVSDGDVKINESTVSHGYSLTNSNGDNVLTNVDAGGFDLTNSGGDNKVFDKTSEGGNIHSGTMQNVVTIKNSDGDNTVR